MSIKSKDGGQAFPMHERDDALMGMALRDYFAGQALIGQLAMNAGRNLGPKHLDADAMAQSCYSVADAMLIARENNK